MEISYPSDDSDLFNFSHSLLKELEYDWPPVFSKSDGYVSIMQFKPNEDDCTNQIDEAIGAIPNGGVLYFPPGTFLCTLITVDKEIKIIGPGIIKQKNSGATADTPFINVTADNVWFDGITIDGNKANQGAVTGADLLRYSQGADNGKVSNCYFLNSTSHCVNALGVVNLEVKNNRFYNYRAGNYEAIKVQNGASAGCSNIRIFGNYVDGSASNSSCISFNASSTYPIKDSSIIGNVVTVGDDGVATIGIQLYSSSGLGLYSITVAGNVIVAENTSNTTIYGISVGGAAGAYCDNLSISNNVVRECNFIGIEVGGAHKSTVSSNSIFATGTGNTGMLFYTTTETAIVANSVNNFQYCYSVYIGNAYSTNQNNISGNIGILLGSSAGFGIRLQCNHASGYMLRNVVENNTIIGDNTADQYGIRVQQDSGSLTDTRVANNFLYNLSYGVSISSATATHVLNNTYRSVDDTAETYIGDGAGGNVQAPAKGSGTGPTTPGTVVAFKKETINGSDYYIPMMQ